MQLFQLFKQKNDNVAALILRVSFAMMMLPHGAGKLFGIWGGFGFEKTIHHFTENLGVPYLLALIAILIEFFSSLFILVGWKTRINAFLLASVMLVASTFHFKHGFYMNWFGQKAGEGFEFHLLAVGMMLALTFLGAGKYSLDNIFIKKDLK